MPTISELFSVHLRQLELTLAESELLLQREGGLNGELKTSGALCAQFLRGLLSRYVVPGCYRVTSGYIATHELLINRRNLPQCDILITDNQTPPLLKLSDSAIEVLPIQSIIGIVEAKRTLTRASLESALDHINTVIASTGRLSTFKTDEQLIGYNRYVGFHNHSSTKPLLGVIAMKSEMADFAAESSELITQKSSLVDFVWTMDGFALVPGFRSYDPSRNLTWYTHSARPATKSWKLLTSADFRSAQSEFYRSFTGSPDWIPIQSSAQQSREAVMAKVIGLLSLTLSRIFPEKMIEQQISEYYLSAR